MKKNNLKDSGRQAAERIAELWRLHGAQMDVFKIAMREELPTEMRSICGKGYLIASICMNEISVIYNQLKCPLQDSALKASGTKLLSWAKSNPSAQMITVLHEKQQKLLRKYQSLLNYFDLNEPHLKVLEEHIFLIQSLADKLVPHRNFDTVRSMEQEHIHST